MLDANLHSYPCPLVHTLGIFGTPFYKHYVENVHAWKPIQTTFDSGGMLVCPGGGSPYGNDEGCPQDRCSRPLR